MCSCKNEARVANYCNYKLSRDIEKNLGPPTYVDPNKIIVASYSQGNELVFGQNAGQQCVAMSLCSLIYNDTQGISSANDLIQIMNIGNQLYSSLSQLARRAHLMQSELPTALNVFDTDYQLEYSESYSGTVHQEIAIEGYQYCTSLPRAFESLIFESYTNFILIVGCITVIVIWSLKYLILMLEICMIEGSLKVHVPFSKYCLLIVKCIIFRVYITMIYLK